MLDQLWLARVVGLLAIGLAGLSMVANLLAVPVLLGRLDHMKAKLKIGITDFKTVSDQAWYEMMQLKEQIKSRNSGARLQRDAAVPFPHGYQPRLEEIVKQHTTQFKQYQINLGQMPSFTPPSKILPSDLIYSNQVYNLGINPSVQPNFNLYEPKQYESHQSVLRQPAPQQYADNLFHHSTFVASEFNLCPAGRPGLPGLNGADGKVGDPGFGGLPGLDAVPDSIVDNCVLCPAGPNGPVGESGSQGRSGIIGTKGERGESGSDGWDGPLGLPGYSGHEGNKGLPGVEGLEGKAAHGGQGPPGPKGINGVIGAAGIQGHPGLNSESPGTKGKLGPPGKRGDNGIPAILAGFGRQGEPGEPGRAKEFCPCGNENVSASVTSQPVKQIIVETPPSPISSPQLPSQQNVADNLVSNRNWRVQAPSAQIAVHPPGALPRSPSSHPPSYQPLPPSYEPPGYIPAYRPRPPGDPQRPSTLPLQPSPPLPPSSPKTSLYEAVADFKAFERLGAPAVYPSTWGIENYIRPYFFGANRFSSPFQEIKIDSSGRVDFDESFEGND